MNLLTTLIVVCGVVKLASGNLIIEGTTVRPGHKRPPGKKPIPSTTGLYYLSLYIVHRTYYSGEDDGHTTKSEIDEERLNLKTFRPNIFIGFLPFQNWQSNLSFATGIPHKYILSVVGQRGSVVKDTACY